MKAVIYHSMSKNKRCETIATELEGDKFQIKSTKKVISFVPLQMLVYGFKTVFKRPVIIDKMEIDFDKYDEITLISPVWAGQVNIFMRQFLKEHPFQNKKVIIIGSCDGGYKNYFKSFKGVLDDSNHVIHQVMYVKGEQEK